MATTTTNLGLTKPSVNDAADIAVLNANFDKIDTAVAGKAPEGYGLGLTGSHLTALADANEAQRNGWYLINKNTANGIGTNAIMRVEAEAWAHCVQTAYGASYSSSRPRIQQRVKCNGTWSGWVDCDPAAFAPSGYGLGTYAQLLTADHNLNNPLPTGLYRWGSSVPVNAPSPIGYAVMLHIARTDGDSIQKVWHLGTHSGVQISCERYLSDNKGEWEWTNPPMQLGVEYRTTERWNGAPVYTKMVDFGALPNATNKSVAHGITNKSFNVRSEIVGTNTGLMMMYSPNITWVAVTGTDIHITTNADLSANSAFFRLWYTK